MGELPTLLGALLAVIALVLACRSAGFRPPQELPGLGTVGHLLEVLPRGFRPVRWAIDRQNRCALAIDEEGRIAAIAPAGSHYFARLADPSWTCTLQPWGLQVAAGDFSITLNLAGDAAQWERAIAQVRRPTP